MDKQKLYTVLRCVITFAVLFAVGIIFYFFGFKSADGARPTTMQLLCSMVYAGATAIGALILGIVRKNGFLTALIAAAVISFPAIPFSFIISAPLRALTAALDASDYTIYILYEAAILILFAVGTALRFLIKKLAKSGFNLNSFFPRVGR